MCQEAPIRPLRVALTLPSAASLGSYEAGGAAALLVAVQQLQARGLPVRLDAIGAVSSGAFVGLLAARALQAGMDPAALLSSAWIEEASLHRLRGRGDVAPMTVARFERDLPALLDPDDDRFPPHGCSAQPQDGPLAFAVGLAGLQGLVYTIPRLHRDEVITGLTHLDWGLFALPPGTDLAPYVEPEGKAVVDYVLASLSHPGAFPPRLIDRRQDAETYRHRGVQNFPDSGHFWYSDGAILQLRPLGRTLAAARWLDDGGTDDFQRLHMVVHPHTASPAGDDRWTDPDRRPPWTKTISRLFALLSPQALHDDARTIETTNTRLEWADTLVREVGPHLGDEAAAALRRVLDGIDDDRRRLSRIAASDPPSSAQLPDEPQALLRRAVEEVAGLEYKQTVALEVVSPLLLAEDGAHEVDDLLAGDPMGRFWGFVHRSLRESDFALGWDSMRRWLPVLEAHGVPEAEVERVLEVVDERRDPSWTASRDPQDRPRSVPLSARVELGLLMVQALRAALADTLRPSRRS